MTRTELGRVALLSALAGLAMPVCTVRNHPPDVPEAPSGAGRSGLNFRQIFSATAYDPDGDSVSVQFDWGDGLSSWTPFAASGFQFSCGRSYRQKGVYEIRARARDARGAQSEWSSAHELEVAILPPSTPVVSSDSDSIWVDNSMGFSAVSSDPNCEPLSFQFSWGDGDTTDWLECSRNDTSIDVEQDWLWGGVYDVTARACDTSGGVSEWSSPCRVTVQGPTLLWEHDVQSGVWFTPAVAPDGSVIFAGRDSMVYALTPEGDARWQYRMGGGATSSPAVGIDGSIYVLSDDNNIYALDRSGDLLWRYPFGGLQPGGHSNSDAPAVGPDGVIYVAGDHLYALKPDGTLKWRVGRGDSLVGTPSIGLDGTIYVSLGDGQFYALNPDASTRWTHQITVSRRPLPPPALGPDGTVYCQDWAGHLSALSAEGSLLWQIESGACFEPVIGPDGTIYLVHWESYCGIAPDGHKKLEDVGGMPDMGWNSPATVAADGKLYVTVGELMGGGLWALHADTFVWATELGWHVTPPTVASGGRVYTGTDWGLIAFDNVSPLAASSWPCARHDSRHSGWAGGQAGTAAPSLARRPASVSTRGRIISAPGMGRGHPSRMLLWGSYPNGHATSP